MAASLVIESLSVQYSRTAAHALEAVSLHVPQGSCVGIVGPTGAGKSTLLLGLSGILGKHHPELLVSGSTQIGSTTYPGIPGEILFPHVGLVLQEPAVQISGVRDTVAEELRLTLENISLQGRNPDREVKNLLRQLGIEHLADRSPTTLSGGETQRVAMASILVANPSLLLLDEPVTALDTAARRRLRALLHQLKGGTTILLTDTHIDFPLSVCDLIAVMNRGRIEFAASPQEWMTQRPASESVSGWSEWRKLSADIDTFGRHRQDIANRLKNILGY